jgi:hypothetical protein
VLRFCNAIADSIRDEHPDIAIETLAYQYTRKPPKITRPRPNVIICLCSIECCFVHGLAEDPYNRAFADDLRGWSQISNRLWIWDYVINYAHSVSPFPNLQVLQPNVRFFLAHGVKGIYEESCYYTQGSELQELRNYIIAKTLWDPQYSTRTAVGEFCTAYYGAAAPSLVAYLKLIEDAVLQPADLHVRIYTAPQAYLTPPVLAQAGTLFDQAEAAVANDTLLLRRVRTARLPLMYAQIALGSSRSYSEEPGRLVQEGGEDLGALADRFGTIARTAGVTMVREGGPQAGLDAWLAAVPQHARELPVVTLHSRLLTAEVLPDLGGRMWRLTYLPDRQQVLRVTGQPEAWSPDTGGYEEYSQGEYRSAGWSEVYTVTDRTDRAVTLQTTLRNGLTLTRRYELAADSAVLHISSTLANGGTEPVTACLRSHPEFNVSSTADGAVRLHRKDGTVETVGLANPTDPSAEKDWWLKPDAVPAGQWDLVDRGTGLVIADRFVPGEVSQALLNWSGRQGRVNLELYGQEVTLAPHTTVALRHTLEISKP